VHLENYVQQCDEHAAFGGQHVLRTASAAAAAAHCHSEPLRWHVPYYGSDQVTVAF
jgi:hypothetical protein